MMSEWSPMTAGESAKDLTSSYQKKSFLKKGEGGGISCAKAKSLRSSREPLSAAEKMDMLEKMQKDHLEKLETKMKRLSEQATSRQAQGVALVQGNGCPQETLMMATETPEHGVNVADSIAERSISPNSLQKSGLEGSCVQHSNPSISDSDKIQIHRMKRRLSVALRETERERQAVQCWSQSQRCLVTKWVAQQKTAISKDRHEKTKSALLVERAQRDLSGAEYSEKHLKREVDCLKATIEKLKLEKMKQEKRAQNQERKLKERIRNMASRIHELEGMLLGSISSDSLFSRSPMRAQKEDLLQTTISNNLMSSTVTSDEGNPHAEGKNIRKRESFAGNTFANCLVYHSPNSPIDTTSKIDCGGTSSVKTNSDYFPQVFTFSNGDLEKVLQDGTIIYYYAEIATTQTSYTDGLEEFTFPVGQIERHFPDGKIEVLYPDSTKKVIHSNGTKDIFFPDGVRVHEDIDGTRCVMDCRNT